MCIRIYIYICVCVYPPAYMYIYIYVYIYVWARVSLVSLVNKRLFTVILTPSAKLVISWLLPANR